MIPFLAQFTTLNKKEAFQQFSRQFQETDPQVWVKTVTVLALLAVAVILVHILMRLQRRRNSEQRKSRPMTLFLGSLVRMKIPVWDIVQLWRLARELRITHPVALLISAAMFDDAVSRYCQHARGRVRRRRSHNRLMAMREVLFSSRVC
ncbi:MAG: hypothetical protein KA354_03800 [Phycisphaerae bacterium]|nr:hypothetical protein [Phycisphaerae bacterium]